MAAAPADTMCLRNRALARRRLGLADSTCVDMFAGFGGSSTYKLLCLVCLTRLREEQHSTNVFAPRTHGLPTPPGARWAPALAWVKAPSVCASPVAGNPVSARAWSPHGAAPPCPLSRSL